MNPLEFPVTKHFREYLMDRNRIHAIKRKARRARLCLEALEDRTVPSSLSVADTSAVEGASALRYVDQFVTAGSDGLTRPRQSILGPDGNLYVASADTNSVLRYNGTTGTFIDAFVASGSGGLNGPCDLAFGPDGNLYVSSTAGNQVLSYNGSTGAFLSVVVSGLSSPDGITFGSDGSLYIANQGTNEVLRESGGNISAFVTAGSGGLNRPFKAVFGQDGNLYVTSYGTQQVLRYNGSTGAFLNVFASTNWGQGATPGPIWLEFGTDGYLYTTARTASTGLDTSILRFNATTGAFVDSFDLGRDGWSFNLGANNVVYDSGNGAGNFVDRYGPLSLEAFTVSLDSASTSQITVNYSTADGTALAGTNYTAASGTLTFAPGVTSQTILVQTLDDGIANGTTIFTVNLSNPVGATISRGQATGTIIDGDKTKFYTVDSAGTASTYRYGLSGNTFGSSSLSSGDSAPRGIAANAAGTTYWVVDANKNVYVYSTGGALLGSWSAGGLSSSPKLTGIATNGTDIWLVDSSSAKVYKYTGAASRLSGSQSAASSFNLVSGKNGNTNPQDLVTDGTSFWVVDGSKLKVFKYTLSGSSLGSWGIDPANTNPTGITINPTKVSDIWIVDSGTDKVYQYIGAASRTSGSQTAVATFALAAGNTNPQGIADPPTSEPLLPAAAPLAATFLAGPSLSSVAGTGMATGLETSSLIDPDAVAALLDDPSFGLSGSELHGDPAGSGIGEWSHSNPAASLPLAGSQGVAVTLSSADRVGSLPGADGGRTAMSGIDAFFALFADEPLTED
jgi:hypothetical protein